MYSVNFSTRFAFDIIEFLDTQGFEVDPLYQVLGIPKNHIRREDIRIPSEQIGKLWAKAMDISNNNYPVLCMVAAKPIAALQTISLIMKSCDNFKEALDRGIAFSALINNALELDHGETAEHIYVEFAPHPTWSMEEERVVFDSIAGGLVAMTSTIRQMVGRNVTPDVITFTFERPAGLEAVQDLFPCPLEFNKSANRLAFPRELASLTIPTRDPGLLSALEAYGKDIFITSGQNSSLAQQLSAHIAAHMGPDLPSLDQTAEAFNLSPRTLQRKLREESDCSYKKLLDDVRTKLANKLLQDKTQSIDHIGYLLGYADTTSFIRAFKRWHGHTPRQEAPS